MSSKRHLDTPEKKDRGMASKKLAFEQGDTERATGLPGGDGGDGDQCRPPQWFSSFSQKFNDRFSRLEERMETLLVKRLDEFGLKLDENAEKVTACTIQLDEAMLELRRMKKEKEEIIEKLDDLENRSRRNNLVFHGVPEARGEKCQETVKALLCDFVGISPDTIEIERCHRTPTGPASTADHKPRIIHVAFSTYGMKEKVRKSCIAKFKKNKFKEEKIYVSEDFSKRVMNKRKNKLDKLKQLKEEGKKPFFIFPDKLAYRNKEGKLFFVD